MAMKKFRNMKVYEQSGYQYKSTPAIMLKGQWLREASYVDAFEESGRETADKVAEKKGRY